jgi:hypothetical protein
MARVFTLATQLKIEFKIELAQCFNVVLAWHPLATQSKGVGGCVSSLYATKTNVFDAEPW